jgi:GT2 family glycosyltransferase
MPYPTVYIVTVAHNRRSSTKAFCDCLNRQTYRNFVLVLVDDGSTDGTEEMVQPYIFRKEICIGNGTLWWAGGVRRGLARVKALNPDARDMILIANDDTSFEDDFLEKAVGELSNMGPGVMLCASIRFTDTDRWNDGGTVCYWPRLTFKHYGTHPDKIDCASTRCIFFCFSDLAVSGSFRPRLLPQYLSDYEFTIRARKRGLRLLPSRSVICHATEQTTGTHRLLPGSLRGVMAQMLSPRFSANPRSLFMFVYTAAPPAWRPVCWAWAFRTVFAFFLKATIFDRLLGDGPGKEARQVS